MHETPDEVRARLTREAQDRCARRMQNATSIGASDAALHDLNFAIKRIDAMTDAQLAEQAAAAGKAREAELEKRMHQALKAAWKHVDIPFASKSARQQVRRFVEAESVAGMRVEMLFALQTAWPFVHGSGDTALMAEIPALWREAGAWPASAQGATVPA